MKYVLRFNDNNDLRTLTMLRYTHIVVLESISFSFSKAIISILWKQMFFYGAHTSAQLASILGLINLIHALASYSYNVYFSIIFPPKLSS